MERKTKPTMSKLRLPLFRRLKGWRDASSAFINASVDALILFDKSLNFVRLNAAAEKLANLVGEDVVGKNILDVVPNIKETGRYDKYLNVIETGKPFSTEDIVPHPKFGNIHLRVRAFKAGNGLGMIISDITERKRGEESLQESEERFRYVLENSPDMIYWLNLRTGEYDYVSPSSEKVAGYASQEMEGLGFREIGLQGHPDDWDIHIKNMLNLLAHPDEKDKYSTIEYRFNHKKLGYRWMSDCRSVIYDADNTPIAVVGALRDITESKRVEEEIKYQANLVENVSDAIISTDLDFNVVSWNKAAEIIFGWRADEVIGKAMGDIVSTEYIQETRKQVPEYFQREGRWEGEVIQRRKDGTPVNIMVSVTMLRDSAGNPVGAVTINRDITERKKMEEALREGTVRFRELFENMSSGVAVYEAVNNGEDFIFKDFNPAGEKIEKIGKKDVIGKRVTEAFPGVEEFGIFEVFQRVWRTGKPEYFPEAIYKDERDPGTWRESWVYKLPTGEIVAVYNDITERKKAEEALKQSLQLLNDTGEMAKVGGWELDLATNEVSWTEEVARIHGVGPEYKVSLEEAINFYAPESIPVLEATLKKTMETGEPYDLESLFIPSGSKDKIWVRSLGRAIYSGGKIVKLAGTFRNIDKYKRAQEALSDSEGKWRSLAENSPDHIMLLDLDLTILFINRTLPDLTKEEVIGTPAFKYVPPEYRQTVADCYKRVAASGKPDMHSTVYSTKEGESRWFEVRVGPVFKNGQVVAFVSGSTDITERKRAEQALQESEAKFRNVLDNSLDMVYGLNLQTGTYDYVSPSTEKILGYSPEEFVAFTIEEGRSLAHPDDLARLDENVIELVTSKEGISSGIEYRIKHKELGYRWVSDSRSVVYDDGNNPVAVVGSLRDITERKRAEEALRQSEEKLLIMFEAIVEGVTVTDLQGNMVQVNEAVLRLHGYSRKEEILGRNAFELISPKDHVRAQDNMRKTLEEGQIPATEYTFLTKDGKEFEAELTAAVLEDKSGNATGLIALTKDITERKRTEEALRESEANHRELADSISDVFFAMDENLRYIYWNKASEKLTGIEAKDAIGKSIYEVFGDTDQTKRAADIYREVLVRQKSQTFENEFQFGGKYYIFEMHAYPSKKGISVFTRDISERRLVEEALRESESKFRNVLEHSVDVIYQVNLKTDTYDYVSPSSLETLGYSPEKLIALGFGKASSVVHPDDMERMKEHFNKVMKRAAADDKESPTIEYRVKHKKSGYRWMSDTSSVLCDEQKVPIAIIGSIHDIT
jgi:PAS domain S-box-containing protein